MLLLQLVFYGCNFSYLVDMSVITRSLRSTCTFCTLSFLPFSPSNLFRIWSRPIAPYGYITFSLGGLIHPLNSYRTAHGIATTYRYVQTYSRSSRVRSNSYARALWNLRIFLCDNGDRKTRKTISQQSTRNEEGEEKVAELWDQSWRLHQSELHGKVSLCRKCWVTAQLLMPGMQCSSTFFLVGDCKPSMLSLLFHSVFETSKLALETGMLLLEARLVYQTSLVFPCTCNVALWMVDCKVHLEAVGLL